MLGRNAPILRGVWSGAIIIVTIIIAVLASFPATAQSIADHFRGKTIRILVPSAPGGDRALYPITFAPFFSKNLPGNPNVQVVFMPGAGGSTAVNNAYGMTAPDGLTLVTPLVAVATAQAVGEESVKYDVTKFKIVLGYQSAGKRNLALETGELEAAITTWNDIRTYHSDWVRDGGIMR